MSDDIVDLSPAEDEVGDPLVALLEAALRSPRDLDRFHQAELMMRHANEVRKAQAKKFQEIEKLWDQLKRQVRPQIIESVHKHGEGGTIVRTAWGTTHLQTSKKDRVKLTNDIYTDTPDGGTTFSFDIDKPELTAEDYFFRTVLKPSGREKLEAYALEQAKAGKPVEWAEITPAGEVTPVTKIAGTAKVQAIDLRDVRPLIQMARDLNRNG